MTRFATPPGTSLWSVLVLDKDGYGDRYMVDGKVQDNDKLGSYRAKLRFDPDTEGFKAFMDALEVEAQELLRAEQAQNAAARMAPEWINLKDEFDKEAGVYTGLKILEAKKPVGFIANDGTKKYHPLGIFDVHGSPWQAPEGGILGNGSILRIEVEPWLRSQGNNQYRMYFRLCSVRVLHAEIYRPSSEGPSVFDGVEEEESFEAPTRDEEAAPF